MDDFRRSSALSVWLVRDPTAILWLIGVTLSIVVGRPAGQGGSLYYLIARAVVTGEVHLSENLMPDGLLRADIVAAEKEKLARGTINSLLATSGAIVLINVNSRLDLHP